MPPNLPVIEIDTWLVQRLVANQFPLLAHLEIYPVSNQGWDNRTFRLGTDLLVRLPSAERYAAQVHKEQRWLPYLAKRIGTKIPTVYACGIPGCGYPWDWSIYHWIEGHDIDINQRYLESESEIALGLASFLCELHCVDVGGGPKPGQHNFYRGASLHFYAKDTCHYIDSLRTYINQREVNHVWKEALSSDWTRDPVWIHGDLEASNLLLKDGQWNAVLDFGSCAVGDPACDLVMAWTYFTDVGKKILRSSLDVDENTWQRAKGWALWKALYAMHSSKGTASESWKVGREIVEAVIRT